MADKATDALIERAATLIAWSNDENYPMLTPERQYHYRKQASPLYAAGLLSNPVPKPTSAETERVMRRAQEIMSDADTEWFDGHDEEPNVEPYFVMQVKRLADDGLLISRLEK